jgi:nitric oxide synthase-interacting protein
MKPLDHCNLCLVQVVDSVACSQAHIYCRECAYNDLLAQKAGIEVQKREIARWEAEDARVKAEARERARERVVRDFERGMGLAAARKAAASRGASGTSGASGASTPAILENGASPSSSKPDSSGGAIIRDDDVDRIARAAEDAAAAQIESEASEDRKAKLAAFWLPSLAPEAPLGPLKAVKLQTLCHIGGAGGAHPHTRKALLPVLFTYPPGKDGAKASKPFCPSCTKELSNATGAVLLSSRVPVENGEEPVKKKAKKDKKKDKDTIAVCGHVVCKTCADTLVRPSKRCCICEATVEESGILPLGREGEYRAVLRKPVAVDAFSLAANIAARSQFDAFCTQRSHYRNRIRRGRRSRGQEGHSCVPRLDCRRQTTNDWKRE